MPTRAESDLKPRAKLRVAIIGFGEIAEKGHLPIYQNRSDFEVVAIVDPTAKRRNVAKNLLFGVCVYEDLTDLLGKDKSEVELLDICSPPVYHAQHVKAALEAGRHVICEKPIAFDPDEIIKLVEMSQKKNLQLFPLHTYKYSSIIKTAIEQIKSGIIGEPIIGCFRVFRNGSAPGTMDWRPFWRSKEPNIAGGGILFDHGYHVLYLINSFLNKTPRFVSARLMYPNSGVNNTLEHTALVLLDFGNSVCTVELTWLANSRYTEYRLTGTNGEMLITPGKLVIKSVTNKDKVFVFPNEFDNRAHPEWFGLALDQFVEYYLRNMLSTDEAKEAYLVSSVISAAYKSHNNNGSKIRFSFEDNRL